MSKIKNRTNNAARRRKAKADAREDERRRTGVLVNGRTLERTAAEIKSAWEAAGIPTPDAYLNPTPEFARFVEETADEYEWAAAAAAVLIVGEEHGLDRMEEEIHRNRHHLAEARFAGAHLEVLVHAIAEHRETCPDHFADHRIEWARPIVAPTTPPRLSPHLNQQGRAAPPHPTRKNHSHEQARDPRADLPPPQQGRVHDRHEAQALTEAAAALMLRYAITETDLDPHDVPDEIVTRSYVLNGPYAQHLIAGITELARALNVMCMLVAAYGNEPHLLHGRKTRGHSIRLIGHSREIDDAVTLIRSVVTQALAFTPRWAAAMKHKRGITVSADDKRSFLVGYLYAAARRVEENRNQIVQEQGAGTELAIRNRWTQIEHWAADQFNVQVTEFTAFNGAADEGARHGRDARVGETELTMGRAITA